MQEEKVLLRVRPDGLYQQVGVIVSRRGKDVTVADSEGNISPHKLQPGEITPVRGSLIHLMRVAPAAVERAMEEAPEVIFLQLLVEAGGGLSARELKAKLSEFDGPTLDKAWGRAKKVLGADPHVERLAGNKYRAKIADHRFTELFPTEEAPRTVDEPSALDHASTSTMQGSDATTDTTAEKPLEAGERGALAPRTNSPARDASAGSGSDDGSRALIPSVGEVRPETPRNSWEDRDSEPLGLPAGGRLLAKLHELGIASAWDSVEALFSNPLSFGLDLTRLKATELQRLLDGLEPADRELLALVLGDGKEGHLAEECKSLSSRQHDTVLRAAIDEVARSGPDAKRLYPRLAELEKRATAATAPSAPVLIDLARTFSGARHLGRTGLEVALLGLANRLRGSRDGGSELHSWNLERLAGAAKAAEFRRTGGRSALVAAVHKVDRFEAAKSRWWHGVTFDQLCEAGHGPLAAALEDQEIAARVVQPHVRDAVGQAVTRGRLARLWSAPAPVARWMSGSDLKAAMLRAGGSDAIAREWGQQVTDSGESAKLSGILEQTRSDLQKSRETELTLRAQVANLEERIATLAEQLAASRADHVDLRGAHERQLKLALVTTIARLAAQVGQSPIARQDAALLRSVSHAANREGLEPIGQTGDVTAYDPALHDPMGHVMPADSPAVVVRHGYTWSDGREVVVMLKAQVVPEGR